MGQHTSAARKVLTARVDPTQVIAGGGAPPSLTDADTLMALDGISLSTTLATTWGAHTWLMVFLGTLLVWYQPTAQAMQVTKKGAPITVS